MTQNPILYLNSRWLPWLVALFMVIGAQLEIARAAAPLPLGDGSRVYPLGLHIDYLIDPSSQWTLTEIISHTNDDRWQTSKAEVPGFGYSADAYWLRFTLATDSASARQWMLKIDYPHLNELTLCLKTSGSADFACQELGSKFPFYQRPIDYKGFVFPIEIDHPGIHQAYLRIKSSSSISLAMTFMTPKQFIKRLVSESMTFGILFGAIIVMMVYTFLIFLSSRERSHLYYIFFIGSFGFFLFTYRGYGYQFLWPNLPDFNGQCILFSLIMTMVWVTVFARRFMDTAKTMPLADRYFVMAITVGTGLLLLVSTKMLTYAQLIKPTLIYTAAVVVTAIVILTVIPHKESVKLFARSFIVFLFTAAIHVLVTYGFIESNPLTNLSLDFGGILQGIIIILSLNSQMKKVQEGRAKSIAENNAMETCLSALQQVSKSLYDGPKKIPSVKIVDFYQPAQISSGDWYCIEYHGLTRRLFIVLGDATGHGMQSAMVTLAVAGAIKGTLANIEAKGSGINAEESVRMLCTSVNKAVYETSVKINRHMTMVLTCIDIDTGVATYCSAGHNPIWWINGRGASEVICRAAPLGLNKDTVYSTLSFQLKQSDTLVYFTDGLIENGATQSHSREVKKMIKSLKKDYPPEQQKEQLLKIYHDRQASKHASDDCAFLILQWVGSEGGEDPKANDPSHDSSIPLPKAA